MGKRRETLRCKEPNCNKIFPAWNKTGYCRKHYLLNYNRRKQKRWRVQNICLSCGKKKGEKVFCPHCNGLIKYMIRCEICRKKQNEYLKKYNQKKKILISDKGI